MLKRVRIQGYKSFQDLDVELEPLSVLFGPNASGKSNFLDALQLLSRTVRGDGLQNAFKPPHRGKPIESFTLTAEGTRGLLNQEVVAFTLEVDVQLGPAIVDAVNGEIRQIDGRAPVVRGGPGVEVVPSESGPAYVTENHLRYSLRVEMAPRKASLRVAAESLVALDDSGVPKSDVAPFIETFDDGRLRVRAERGTLDREFDAGSPHNVLSQLLYPPHFPHLTAIRREMLQWNVYYFEPRERMRSTSMLKEVHGLGLMGEDLDCYLYSLRETSPSQFASFERALRMLVPSVSGVDVGVNDSGEVELKVIEGKTPIPARVLSEGTLRIMGILALQGINHPPYLVGLEEPENGVHPRRIQLIAEMLKTRSSCEDTQYIVTTHSPLLLDQMPRESLFVCRKVDGKTTIEPLASLGPLGEKTDIEDFLNAESELSVSERALRGDFDA